MGTATISTDTISASTNRRGRRRQRYRARTGGDHQKPLASQNRGVPASPAARAAPPDRAAGPGAVALSARVGGGARGGGVGGAPAVPVPVRTSAVRRWGE